MQLDGSAPASGAVVGALANHRSSIIGDVSCPKGTAWTFIRRSGLTRFADCGRCKSRKHYAIYETSHARGWPGGFVTVLALLCILSPLTALLLFCIYFFRYRLELVRARKKAREQTLADLYQQLRELRQEIEALKKERRPEASQ